ncbi:peptide chain release factor 1-like protein, mitochondrial-like protein [Sarcoptes scabiei]|nr:peptide chain release factor 1-like protein, mitochondrial-like protein [Sarcoptes scabiei]
MFSAKLFEYLGHSTKSKLISFITYRTLRQQSNKSQPNLFETLQHSKPLYHKPKFHQYFLRQYLNINNPSLKFEQIPKELIVFYKQALREFEELIEIDQLKTDETDEEFDFLVQNEKENLVKKLIDLQDNIFDSALVDDQDIDECSIEIRAGIGGKEAILFADELYELYLRFIFFNRWTLRSEKTENEIALEESTSLFNKCIEVQGSKCYSMLRHEAGIHRVQRIPQTEKYGRMHTSTVSISVIPIRKNLVQIKQSDLKFEMKTSSGAGGQNVNRNFTCVRIYHLPTRITVESQETRSQHQNKEIALRKLTNLLNQMEYDRLEEEARKQKRSQIGIAARSDKIRTYNYSQDRITDHRLPGDANNTLHNISGYMLGQECDRMRMIIEQLERNRRRQLLKQIREEFEKQFQQLELPC